MKTHDNYWDCNCDQNYIHHKSEKCPVCGPYYRDAHADARIDEMIKFGIDISPKPHLPELEERV